MPLTLTPLNPKALFMGNAGFLSSIVPTRGTCMEKKADHGNGGIANGEGQDLGGALDDLGV